MPLDLWFLIMQEDFFDPRAVIKVGNFFQWSRRTTGSPGGFLKVSTIGMGVIMGLLWNQLVMLFVNGADLQEAALDVTPWLISIFLLLVLLYEALASRFLFLSAGTFWRRIHEPVPNDSLSLRGVLLASMTNGLRNFFFFFKPFSFKIFSTQYTWADNAPFDAELGARHLSFLYLLISFPPYEEASTSCLPNMIGSLGREVALAVTTKILLPAMVVLVAGTFNYDSLSNTEILS
ncbi:hypothetical protein M5K25_004729 [Dendrobium thyrsiflorum]|uniref:Uncharacterized protein n=1 Tax=Dendrobium thyrsiflorum TaxID=117978 RepID=A0ABD0VFL6_DENTH